MRKQDYLLELIHSLSVSEKRYFNLFNSPQQGAKKYERLFDELALAKTYHADSLCQKLKVSKQQLADDKAYLQKVLLKAMRNYHEQMPYVTLMNQTIDAYLLIQKTMMPWAYEMLSKTIDGALQSSNYEIAWKGYSLQMTAGSDQRREPKMKYADDFERLKGMESCVRNLQLSMEFMRLLLQIFAKMEDRVLAAGPEEAAEIDRLMNHPLLLADYDLPLFDLYKHQALGHLTHRKQDFEASLKHQLRMLYLIEHRPEAISMNGWGYVASVCNVITAYIECNQLKPTEDLVRKLKTRYYHKFISNGKELDPIFDAQSFKLLASAYNRSALKGAIDAAKVKEFVASFAREYRNIAAHMDGGGMVLTINLVSRCCFWIKDYEAAIHWTLESQNNYPPDIVSDFQGTAQIWFAIIHAEMKNFKLLDSLIRNTEKHLKKYKVGDEADKITIRFLKKMHQLKSKSETQAAFGRLIVEYNKLERSDVQIVRSKLVGYKKWAEEKILA